MAELKEKRLFLLDMDGTIYLSETLFDKVPEFLDRVIGGLRTSVQGLARSSGEKYEEFKGILAELEKLR